MSWLSDLFNPPAANVPTPQINSYQPGNLAGADAGAFGGIGNLGQFNTYGNLYPLAFNVGQGLLNNPYGTDLMSGAGVASGLGQAGALGAFGQGQNLYGMAGSLANTAFDPQNALYGRTLQQLQDQTRAGLEARGVNNTPYGAGVENQALSNFNIDWQNNLLNRQVQGAQGAGSLIGQGAGLQAGAPGAYLTASGMPYSTFQGIGQSNLGTLGQVAGFGAQGAQIPQQQVQDYLNYLGWGTGAQGAANQAQLGLGQFGLNQAKEASAEQSNMFGGIGKALGGLWGTGLSGGGTVGSSIMSALPFFSDRRVKDDIVPIGDLYDGTPVYSFRYKGDPTSRVGLMAQDVEKRRPDAVVEIGGIKAVDYGKATEFSRGLSALSKWG